MRQLIFLLGLFGTLSAFGQHHHYLMLQSDQQQPFYVRMGTMVQSSSADGFMIIPRLKDSAYELVVGFPSRKFPEYQFRFAGFKKDRGMALKDFGEKGWGLFDYQTLEVLMGERVPEKTVVKTPPPPPPLTADPFAVVLASAIGDPGLLATPLVQLDRGDFYVRNAAAPATVTPTPPTQAQATPAPAKPKDTVALTIAPVKSKDTAALTIAPAKPKDTVALTIAPAKPKDTAALTIVPAKPKDTVALTIAPAKPVEPAKDPAVLVVAPPKTAEPERKESVGAVPQAPVEPVTVVVARPERLPGSRHLEEGELFRYLDGDTVDVLIPVPKPVAAPPVEPPVGKNHTEQTAPVVGKPASTGVPVTGQDAGQGGVTPAKKAPVAEEMTRTDSTAGPQPPNRTGCARMATDKDLDAVKKKILGIRDEDDMVAAALKDFKQRCFTTAQVRTLSFVFTRQEGKYKLMDAVYPYVYDPSNFPELEPLLTDKYFIHRFKALITR